MNDSIDICILTSIPEEYNAVKKHLFQRRWYDDEKSFTDYEIGYFELTTGKKVAVAIQSGAKKNSVAAAAVERAIKIFNPTLMLLVGTAGGIRKAKNIGDVVVCSAAFNYEAGKDKPDYYAPNSISYHSSPVMINIAKRVMAEKQWKKRSSFGKAVEVYVGTTASGEKVLENTSMEDKKSPYSIIRKHFVSSLIVEMEAYGFLETLSKYGNIQKVVIKSVSDMLYNKAEVNKKLNSKQIASENAAAFAFEVVNLYSQKQRKKNKPIVNLKKIVSLLAIIGLIAIVISLSSALSKKTQNAASTKPKQDTLSALPQTPIEKEKKPIVIEEPSSTHQSKNKSIFKKEPTIHTFKVTNFLPTDSLQFQLINLPNWKFQFQNPEFDIRLHWSGTLEPGSVQGLYFYRGGNLVVQINGEDCYVFQQFKIDRTLEEGNPKNILEEALSKIIEKHIINNQTIIKNQIAACLKLSTQ